MQTLEELHFLNAILLEEIPSFKNKAKEFQDTMSDQRKLLRSLMNIRPPLPLKEEFLRVQDVLLQKEVEEKGIISLKDLSTIKGNPQIYLWQGDITRLAVDVIVNAANSELLGCFIPCHNCIDNVIHSQAGVQLRNACHEIIETQGYVEKTGGAKITPAYNLPSKYVIHTVGPIVHGDLTQKDCEFLESAYRACLELAINHNLESIAFCCISTGVFHFPNKEASNIAIKTVNHILSQTQSKIKVIFNVFKEIDYAIYREQLGNNK